MTVRDFLPFRFAPSSIIISRPIMGRPLLSLLKLCFFVLVANSPVHASPQSNFYITQALERYFELPVDARTLSLSSSDALLCRGSVCNYLNPAGLGFTKQIEVGVTFANRNIGGEDFINSEEIEQSEGRGFIAGAVPLGRSADMAPPYGTLGIGFSRYQGDTNDPINSTPDGHRRTFAYGFAPTGDLSLGYSFTFYDDQLKSDLADLHSHARFLHLFGLQYELGEGYSLGGLFQLGVGQSDTEDFVFKSDGLSRLRQYSSSLALKKSWSDTSIAVAGEYMDLSSRGNLEQVSAPVVIGGTEEGHVFNINLGAETRLIDELRGRVGTRLFSGHYKFLRPDLERLSGDLEGFGLSSGVGYVFKICESEVKIDYGAEYLTTARGEWQHILSLAFLL